MKSEHRFHSIGSVSKLQCLLWKTQWSQEGLELPILGAGPLHFRANNRSVRKPQGSSGDTWHFQTCYIAKPFSHSVQGPQFQQTVLQGFTSIFKSCRGESKVCVYMGRMTFKASSAGLIHFDAEKMARFVNLARKVSQLLTVRHLNDILICQFKKAEP